VGSSNLGASGIDGGVEWNLGTDRVEQLVAGFDSLWADGARSFSMRLRAPSHRLTAILAAARLIAVGRRLRCLYEGL